VNLTEYRYDEHRGHCVIFNLDEAGLCWIEYSFMMSSLHRDWYVFKLTCEELGTVEETKEINL